ncbi:MAG: OmpH family outer membrane protein [Flavobacteriaceae bacterium]|nr:OmpH family outer membrane protein [Flavobacteriaceae bacterium]
MYKKHIYILLILTFVSQLSFSQKTQRLAYIDMAFVLENIPEYSKAQNQLDTKVKSWERRLDREKNEIEAIKKDFSNEKALLTEELIQEREDDIYYKELEYRQLQQAYFGPKGDLYLYRKLLVQPIQDKVYNAIQEIAPKKGYDFVIDKSSDLIMLYTNKRFDISDLVVNSIVKVQKQKAFQDKRNRSKKKKKVASAKKSSPKKNNRKRPVRKKPIRKKPTYLITKPSEDISKSDTQQPKDTISVISESKDTVVKVATNSQPKDSINATAKIKIEETNVIKDAPSDKILKRIQDRNAKRKLMLEKIRLIKEAKDKKREADRKAAADKRAAKLKEINKHKEDLIQKRDSAIQSKKDN